MTKRSCVYAYKNSLLLVAVFKKRSTNYDWETVRKHWLAVRNDVFF